MLIDGHASNQEVHRAQTDLKIAEAQLRIADEERRLRALELDSIQAQLRRRLVVFPFDGVVTEVHAEPGAFVHLSESQVMTVVQLSQLRVNLYIPTETAASLSEGQTAQVRFPDTGQITSAQIRFVSPITDADSGTVRIELTIDNTDGKFRSGVRCLLID